MKLVLSCCFILCYIWLTECIDRDKNKACYQAKICIHNNKEKCGVNNNGRVRRFIDSCDILEYNCLRGTDYEKTTYERCSKLPPMKVKPGGNKSAQSDSDVPQHALSGEASGGDEFLNGTEKHLDSEDYNGDIVHSKHVNNNAEEKSHNEFKHVYEKDGESNISQLKKDDEEDQAHTTSKYVDQAHTELKLAHKEDGKANIAQHKNIDKDKPTTMQQSKPIIRKNRKD